MPDILNPALSTRSVRTLQETRNRVRDLTQLRSTAFITDAEITESLNVAQRLIALSWKGFKQQVVTGTVNGTAEYNLPAPAAARALQIEEIYHDSQPLLYVSQEEMTRMFYRWRTLSGTPTHWLIRGHCAYRLYPIPSVTDTDIVTIIYASLPPEVSAPEDLFYIPHGMDEALVNYGCYMASLKDKTGEGQRRADDFRRDWKEMLAACAVSRDGAVDDAVALGEDGAYGRRLMGSYVPPYTTITG